MTEFSTPVPVGKLTITYETGGEFVQVVVDKFQPDTYGWIEVLTQPNEEGIVDKPNRPCRPPYTIIGFELHGRPLAQGEDGKFYTITTSSRGDQPPSSAPKITDDLVDWLFLRVNQRGLYTTAETVRATLDEFHTFRERREADVQEN